VFSTPVLTATVRREVSSGAFQTTMTAFSTTPPPLHQVSFATQETPKLPSILQALLETHRRQRSYRQRISY
jgi:hypothetical protein